MLGLIVFILTINELKNEGDNKKLLATYETMHKDMSVMMHEKFTVL
tara:strand:+ start:1391 stop:1528 length:138 start_codon:yes stop_codon:yes gene_type:complete